MEWTALLLFLLSAALGSYFQSVTGFAMGMIIIALTGALVVDDLLIVTAAVSLLSLLNVLLALRGHWHEVQRGMVAWLGVGQLATIPLGVFLLIYLDQSAQAWLQVVLGVFIAGGALSMLLRPRPQRRPSSAPATVAYGLFGGLLGGLFSASGPVLGWFGYRQPYPVAVIRASLLACFAVTTTIRTGVLGLQGELVDQVWLYTLLGVPVVLAGTYLGRNWPPPLGELGLKRLAFVSLTLMGLWILASGTWALVG